MTAIYLALHLVLEPPELPSADDQQHQRREGQQYGGKEETQQQEDRGENHADGPHQGTNSVHPNRMRPASGGGKSEEFPENWWARGELTVRPGAIPQRTPHGSHPTPW